MGSHTGLAQLLEQGVEGKRVLVRSDLNVPLDGPADARVITDDGRIRASVPTIRALAEAGARVVVAAHLGRPQGAPDPAYSLAPVAARLGELLGRRPASAEEGAAALMAFIESAGPEHDAALVRCLHRFAVRAEALMAGALGAGEGARLQPVA